jgi:hypothetical protein
MTDEQMQYFITMEDFFGHPGWKLLVEDAKKEIYDMQARVFDLAKSWDEVNILKGRAQQLTELTLLPEILENQKDSMLEAARDNASV